MGNVLAASQPADPNCGGPGFASGIIPPPPPPPSNLPPLVYPPGSEPSVDDDKKKEYSTNPGVMEDLHKKCKDVYPMNFEGAKLIVNKGLSNHFQVCHTIVMSSIIPSGYRFGATYVGTKQISPNEVFPIVLGDVDPSGNLNANIIHQVGNIRAKICAQFQNNKVTTTQMTGDYRGSDFTASLTLGNIDVLRESGVIVAHYLQSITKGLAMGAELAYQYGMNVPGGEMAVLSFAGRYTGLDYCLSGTAGGSGLHLCYYQQASEQIQLGAEFETNYRMQEATASIGYQVEVPKANLVFRGMVDTNWSVSAVLEKKLMPLPFTFSLSGVMNHPKNQFRLGCGLIIG